MIKKNTPHFLCKVSVDFRIFNFSLTLKCVCIFNERTLNCSTNYRSRLLQVQVVCCFIMHLLVIFFNGSMYYNCNLILLTYLIHIGLLIRNAFECQFTQDYVINLTSSFSDYRVRNKFLKRMKNRIFSFENSLDSEWSVLFLTDKICQFHRFPKSLKIK